MTDTTQGIVLFNCCTDMVAPNWAQFKSLEIGGCIEHDDYTEGGVPDDRADFWTVYARHHSGEAEAITDCRTRADADSTGRTLSELSGLPLL